MKKEMREKNKGFTIRWDPDHDVWGDTDLDFL